MPVSVAHVETTDTRRGSVRFHDATDRSLDDEYVVGSKRRRVRSPTPGAVFDKATDRDRLDDNDDYDDRCCIAEPGEVEAAAAVDSGNDEIPVQDFLDDEAVSDAEFLDDSDDEAADTPGVANSDCDDCLRSDDGEDLGSEDTWSNGSSFGGGDEDLEDGDKRNDDNASIASFVVQDDAAIEYASDFTDDEDYMEADTDDDCGGDDDDDGKGNEIVTETSASDEAATTVAERLTVTDETENRSAVSCPAAAADNNETVETYAKRDDAPSSSSSSVNSPSSPDT